MARDIAVIGAGILGVSISWRLVQAGLRVEMLDAGRLGSEASWGMLAPGGETDRRSAWTDLALESLALYRRFVAELEQESGPLHRGLSIDYQEHGAWIASRPRSWRRWRSPSLAPGISHGIRW